MEESSSDNDSSDDDDDVQMAPAAPQPRAPERPARKRTRAGSRPEQPRGGDDDESVPPAKKQPSLKEKLKQRTSPGKPSRRRGV